VELSHYSTIITLTLECREYKLEKESQNVNGERNGSGNINVLNPKLYW